MHIILYISIYYNKYIIFRWFFFFLIFHLSTFFSGKMYFGIPLINQAPLFFHISLVSAQIRQRYCLWLLLDLLTIRCMIILSCIFSLVVERFENVEFNSIPHFWHMYLRQSLQRFADAPNTAPNFSPQRAQEHIQCALLKHLLLHLFFSFNLVVVTIQTLRFIFSNFSTNRPILSCSDKFKASALWITLYYRKIKK